MNDGSVWRPGFVSVLASVCCTIIVLWPRHYLTVQRPVSVGFPSFECCMVRFFWLRCLTLASRACLFISWCGFSRTCARITTLFVVLRRQRAELPTNDSPTWDVSVLHRAGLQDISWNRGRCSRRSLARSNAEVLPLFLSLLKASLGSAAGALFVSPRRQQRLPGSGHAPQKLLPPIAPPNHRRRPH